MNKQIIETSIKIKQAIKKNEECVELKNIKYQTMLINNNNLDDHKNTIIN